MRLGLAVASTVFLVCLVVPSSAIAAGGSAHPRIASRPAPRNWLGEINYYRKGAGLAGVSNNTAWDKGILNHLRYLDLTPAKYYTGEYKSAHTENPKSPYYTKSGALEASRSDLILGGMASPKDAVDIWLGAPFHAIGMLRPGLKQVAIAVGYFGAGLDVIGGLDSTSNPKPVFFPGNGVTTNLTTYLGELPDPTQSCHWNRKDVVPGLPLIALLPNVPERNVVARLQTPSGTEESGKGTFCVVDEYTYHSTDKIYGPTGLEILEADNAIILIPNRPLVKGRYTVTVDHAAKVSYSWSFSVRT